MRVFKLKSGQLVTTLKDQPLLPNKLILTYLNNSYNVQHNENGSVKCIIRTQSELLKEYPNGIPLVAIVSNKHIK